MIRSLTTTGSPLRAVLSTCRAFGDLAVQIHWGDAVEDQDVAWHVDANNSALHMAVPEVGAKQQGDGYLWCVYIIYIYANKSESRFFQVRRADDVDITCNI